MGWVGQRWRAFNAAAGPRRFVIFGLISGVIAAWDHLWPIWGKSMTALIGVPSWAVGIIVALLFCFWWVLEELVRVRRRIKGARFGLAKLRREGVALRNEGRCITNTKALDDWKRHVDDWNNRTIAGIEKINEADAEWFSILDVVPPPRLEIEKTISIDLIASANHHKAYNEHDLRVKRLGRMLYKVWER